MIPTVSRSDRRLRYFQRHPGVPIGVGQNGCGQSLRWLAYAPSESQAGRQRTTLPAAHPKAMVFRQGK